jgi:hypothetical protein
VSIKDNQESNGFQPRNQFTEPIVAQEQDEGNCFNDSNEQILQFSDGIMFDLTVVNKKG